MDCIQVENPEKVVKFLASELGYDEEEAEFAELFQKQQDDLAKIPVILEASMAKDCGRAEPVPTSEACEREEIKQLMVFRMGRIQRL